jgi:hypothetical protein
MKSQKQLSMHSFKVDKTHRVVWRRWEVEYETPAMTATKATTPTAIPAMVPVLMLWLLELTSEAVLATVSPAAYETEPD